MLWLSQVSRVCSGIEPVGLDDLAQPVTLAGVLLGELTGLSTALSRGGKRVLPLQELAGVLTSDGGVEGLLGTGHDVARFHLVVFCLVYIWAIQDPRHAQEVCTKEFLSVPNELKFSAKAFGDLVRKSNSSHHYRQVLFSPLHKTGLDVFLRADFGLEHVLQLYRSATVSSSRALLELALQLRVDLFPETEQQALLLVSLGKELALPLGHLIALARNDRNPKFRALLVDQLREQTPDSFAGLLVQECFVEARKCAKTHKHQTVLDMYHSTLAPWYFQSDNGQVGYSPVAELVNGNVDQSSPVNTTTTAVVAGGNKAAPLTLQLPKLVNPTTASIKLEPSLVKLESSSLTRSLAEKTKPKPPPTIVKITTTTTTASTSTAAQLRNKLKQRT
ncbi:hypothetical protein BASA81_003133 [Batrachochytrium salamandrivorans]|nr:hypothetical protein BASA81_003133 [Batrachochytrium salamandrivorans]